MVSVSRATNSPGRIFRPPASLNQGLVRCPEVSSRVSMNSPPCRMTSWYMMAKRSFSETPGSMAARTAATAASAPAIDTCRHLISSCVLMARTASISPWQSRTSQPRLVSARACKWLQRSRPRRIDPPPCWRSRSAISSAKGPAVSSSLPDTADQTNFDGHRDMLALRILEKDDGAFGGDEKIACRVAQKIPEHIARTGGITLVVGIEKNHRAVTGLLHPGAQTCQPALAQGIDVDEGRLGIGQPHPAGGIECNNAHGSPPLRRPYTIPFEPTFK